MTTVTFVCFMKLDVCATLYILWQCSNSSRVLPLLFHDFVHSLAIPSYFQHTRLKNTYACQAINYKSPTYTLTLLS